MANITTPRARGSLLTYGVYYDTATDAKTAGTHTFTHCVFPRGFLPTSISVVITQTFTTAITATITFGFTSDPDFFAGPNWFGAAFDVGSDTTAGNCFHIPLFAGPGSGLDVTDIWANSEALTIVIGSGDLIEGACAVTVSGGYSNPT